MSSETAHDVDDEQDEDGEDEDAGEGLVDDDGGHGGSMPMSAPGPAQSAETRAVPIRDVALCIELGERPIMALMTPADWDIRVRQELAPWTRGDE